MGAGRNSWGGSYFTGLEKEQKLRRPGMKRRVEWVYVWRRKWQQRKSREGWMRWREQMGERGRERFRQGCVVGGMKSQGFAGAAWKTSDLNGVLNPAVAYPDFSSIPFALSTVRYTKARRNVGSHSREGITQGRNAVWCSTTKKSCKKSKVKG